MPGEAARPEAEAARPAAEAARSEAQLEALAAATSPEAETPEAEAACPEAEVDATAAQWGWRWTEGYVAVTVTWLRQISKHLCHVEGRIMKDSILGHEVVRQVVILIDKFCRLPCGGWG